MPTMPLNAAGLRKLPPISEPVQSVAMPQASATAEPPEEPAAERSGSNGLPVAPYTALRVFAPAPNSGVLVLAKMMPPAARMAATLRSSLAGTLSLNSGLPKVVRSPAVSSRSFTPTGRPCSAPKTSPRMTAASAARAASRAAGTSIATTAFTAWFTASIRRRLLSSSSTGESCFVPIRRRASMAERSQGSVAWVIFAPQYSPQLGLT